MQEMLTFTQFMTWMLRPRETSEQVKFITSNVIDDKSLLMRYKMIGNDSEVSYYYKIAICNIEPSMYTV